MLVNGKTPDLTAVLDLPAPLVELRPDRQRPLLSELDITHHPKVAQAVQTARDWYLLRQQQKTTKQPVRASMVLLATQVNKKDGTTDLDRTGYGCGKTHIARACLWTECLVMDGEPIAPIGKFFLAMDIIGRLDGETPAAVEIAPAPIIVLDDVGTEGAIQFVGKELQVSERHARYFKIFDYCYQAGVSVVVTANLTIDGLMATIGGRAYSRLLQMAPSGFILDMTGVPDYRRKAGGRG